MPDQKLVVNCTTGEQQLLDLSATEIADKQQLLAAEAAAQQARAAAAAQLAADRASVLHGVVLSAAPPEERQAFARLLGLVAPA
jgi:hypothetical protein